MTIQLSPLLPATPQRAGHKKQNLSGKLAYTTFLPTKLQDVELTYTAYLTAQVGNIRALLAELATRYELLPAAKQAAFTQQMIGCEALASLKLTQAEAITPDNPDLYWLKRAIPYAFTQLQKLPISRRLLTEVHDMVMHDPSHYKQNPGEFRRSPIWIGRADATLTKGVTFVPPAPDDMVAAFSDLEHYINEERDTEPLVKAALIHYQLEMIHPFLDGNGRVGRLVNQLYLKEAGLLPAPILPLSEQLLTQRFFYYAHLFGVEKRGAYETWVTYWLSCTQNAAESALAAIQA